MAPERFSGFRRQPLDVADWEDLLVRFEIMPRALRVAMEDGPAGEEGLSRALLRLVDREEAVGRWLEALASGGADPVVTRESGGLPAPQLAERFAAVRARNFAMLQRRGVDVWDWTAELEGTPVSVYQMVAWSVRCDGDTLAALRSGEPAAGRVTTC